MPGSLQATWQVWVDAQLFSYRLWDLEMLLHLSEQSVNRENSPCLAWVVVRFRDNLHKALNKVNGTQ